MNTLLENLEKETNFTTTENQAKTHKSSLSSLVDFFGLGAALRSRDEQEIISLFSKAFAEDRLLALKALFYIRDVRGGQGERKTFRTILKWLANNYPEVVSQNLEVIAEFGRWDDLLALEGTKCWQETLNIIKNEWTSSLNSHKPSLMFKWLPSINTSSKETRRLAKIICKALQMKEKEYRQSLAKFRSALNVVEKDMCANNWKEINYSSVPSKATLIYKDAFQKHDKERYGQFIADVKKGKVKINASVTYPYEIVERILDHQDQSETLDVIWEALPNYLEGNEHEGIVVADVSGSMAGRPMAVSISLALYFAERNKGPFKDYFMTFSENPELVKVEGNNIREKVMNLSQADWQMNTNLVAVFDKILETATKHNVVQSEMPKNIYIVSDMEFDAACEGDVEQQQTNFEVIQRKYQEHGYQRPNLIFWNVNSRNNQAPITKDDKGTCMVSGCSPIIFKTLLEGGEITAYDVMIKVLSNERYNCIIC